MSFNIIGTGSAVPANVVTNADLEKFLDTSDEWITTRTGISERRVLKDKTLLELACDACKKAIDNAGVNAEDIDMIISSSVQGDYLTPPMTCLISKELEITPSHLYDINMGCTGFIFALDMADSFFKAKKVKKVLIVCAEAMTRFVDWADRATCVLFGDGAGAVVLEAGDGLVDLKITVNGSSEHLHIGRNAGNSPFDTSEKDPPFLYMDGQEIYKFAVSAVARDIKDILKNNSLTPDDISYYLLHQANMRILESAKHRLKQPEEKFPHNVERYGNTSSASIPLLLDEKNREGKLTKGNKILLSAFGAGLTTGVCIINWN